jgi:hypothetical protein
MRAVENFVSVVGDKPVNEATINVAIALNEIGKQDQSALYALDHRQLVGLLEVHRLARLKCSS